MSFLGLASYLNLVHDVEMPPDHLTFCALTITFLLMSTTCSILFILKMTFERFYSIIMPHKAASFNTVKRAKITIAIIVFSCILFNIPHMFTSTHVGKECVPWGSGMEKVVYQLHYYTSFFINFALPFVSLLIMNSVIIHTLRTRPLINVGRSKGQGQAEGQTTRLKSSEKQIYILLLLVTFAFLILTTPGYAMVMYVNFVDYTKSPRSCAEYYLVYHIGQKTYFTNYGINFFLYVISGQRFRSDLMNIFKCNHKQDSNVNVISDSATKSTQMSLN